VNLKLKFSLFVCLAILVAISAAGIVLALSRSQQITDELIFRDRIIGEKIAPELITDFADYYAYQFEKYVQVVQKQLNEYGDIVQFRMINAEGRVLFDSREMNEGKYEGEPRMVQNPANARAVQEGMFLQDYAQVDGEKTIRMLIPYRDRYGDYRAMLEMHFSMREVRESITEMIRSLTALLGICLALGIALAVAAISRITAPILQLTKNADEISRGNLGKEIKVSAGGEIGKLALALEHMRLQLRSLIYNLAEEKAQLIASIHSLSFGFMIVDRAGHSVIANPAMKKFFGKTAAQELTFQDMVQKLGNVFDITAAYRSAIEKNHSTEAKEFFLGNRYFKLMLVPILLRRGKTEIIGAVIAIEDITEQKLLDQSKDNFIGIASHEMRTPLTVIKGYAQQLERKMLAHAAVDDKMSSMAASIHRNSNLLLDIINDFLDLSAVEAGKISLRREQFDVAAFIEENAADLREIAAEKNLQVRVEKPAAEEFIVYADKERTKQILFNIAGNAIHFTEKGGVVISVRREGGFIAVAIADTGAGIPADRQSMLFKKFSTVRETFMNTKEYGSGLGLYISKLLVEAMGGSIELTRSTVGEGSVFTFRLPVQNATFISA
jgi:signal transduction histidine kinase